MATLTLGLWLLLTRWIPKLRIFVLGRLAPLSLARWIVVENQFQQLDIIMVQRLAFGGDLSELFPFVNASEDRVVPYLFLCDYRRLRFVLHPEEGKYMLAANFKNPAWKTVESMRQPLTQKALMHRRALVGTNDMNIPVPPVLQLLIDEVLHPFYIFQIFSIFLWLLEAYEVYAATIFIMSVASIISTLIETRDVS